ncbi:MULTISPECIES: IS30 family transposase, partial [unclassified Mycobacteroides]
AGCDESRTSGAEGGPGKRARSNPGTAPRSDPYIIGKNHQSAIGTLVERSTRYVMLLHLPASHNAGAVQGALLDAISTLPTHLRRSLTWDQGSEMGLHKQFSIAADMPVYFCDPGSPWQRGTNENTNGLLRQYFPKGTDLSLHTRANLDAVATELNSRPRKSLDWDTPAQRLATLIDVAA